MLALAWDLGCVGHGKGQPDTSGPDGLLHNHTYAEHIFAASLPLLIPLSHGAPVGPRSHDYDNPRLR